MENKKMFEGPIGILYWGLMIFLNSHIWKENFII